MADDSHRQWTNWVAVQIGGDEFRQRTALEAAMQALQSGRSSVEAAAAAHRAVGTAPIGAAPVVTADRGFPAPSPGTFRCRFCGSIPAANMTVFEHNGLVILMTFKNLKGPFCRNCGLSTWRRMTNTTLLRGWLGVFSFFIAPITVLVNLINLHKLTSLAPPDQSYAVRQPADPGSGLFKRAGVYVYAAVLAVVLLVYVIPALGH